MNSNFFFPQTSFLSNFNKHDQKTSSRLYKRAAKPFSLFHIIWKFHTWWLWLHKGEIIHALQWTMGKKNYNINNQTRGTFTIKNDFLFGWVPKVCQFKDLNHKTHSNFHHKEMFVFVFHEKKRGKPTELRQKQQQTTTTEWNENFCNASNPHFLQKCGVFHHKNTKISFSLFFHFCLLKTWNYFQQMWLNRNETWECESNLSFPQFVSKKIQKQANLNSNFGCI